MSNEDLATGFNETVEKHTGQFLGLQLWLIHMEAPVSLDDMTPYIPDHIDYALSLERDGVLFAAGPVADAAGGLSGRGLFIVHADNREKAEQIANNDPLVKNGVRRFKVEQWTLNVGQIQQTVRLSNQTIAFR